jgi:hypothetical protein
MINGDKRNNEEDRPYGAFFYTDRQLWQRLHVVAIQSKKSVSSMVTDMIRDFLNNQEVKNEL